MANKQMRFCPRRFEALVLHILSVKEMNYRTLMRVLWGIDMAAFAKQGKRGELRSTAELLFTKQRHEPSSNGEDEDKHELSDRHAP